MIAPLYDPAALASCASEPIHLLGAIQPMGALLTISADWNVLRCSANAGAFLGVADEMIGQPAKSVFPADFLHDVRGRLQIAIGTGIVERLFGCRLATGSPRFDVAVHVSGNEIVLEFEASTGQSTAPLGVLRSMTARAERQTSTQAICQEAARQMRGLTGFDRVMVYRFDDDDAGEVIAETAAGTLAPFLGLRYPASDIPEQARALYKRNFLRIIADVDADLIPVLPVLSPEGVRLDLSMSGLRSVSPIHLEYLRNMGVQASMSVSIIVGGQLWGLIACHHGKAMHLGLETRSTAELFGQMFSYLLEARLQAEDAAYDLRTHNIHNGVALAFAASDALLKNVPEILTSVADYVAADGIAVSHAGEISLTGLTPTREEFAQLVRFLNTTSAGQVFSTHCLSGVFPPALDYPMRAAGMLSIPVSRVPRDYLVFFRREVEKSVTWAGRPEKIEALGPHGVRLTPRKSFEAWRETVRFQSPRWSKGELRAAEKLRVTMIELILRMSESAQVDRNTAQQSQEILIAELNHRVRNILGLVRGLISQSAATAVDIRALVESLDNRIRSLARAQDLLTSSDWMPTPLRALLSVEVETYGNIEDRLTLTGPEVILMPKAFTPMALVVHELVTNARKYGALSTTDGRITVTTSRDEAGNVSIAWCETGGPMVSAPQRKGFGSTVLGQVIPFELNGMSTPRYLPGGYCLDIILPAAAATCAEPEPQTSFPDEESNAPAPADIARLLTTCLLVEDNLFIAVDAEDLLRALGAKTVVVANSVADALAALAMQSFGFALLDVNLGPENSLPIGRYLKAHAIPFVFGTGYGEDLAMGELLADVPIVTKPYHRLSMLKALTRLIPTGSAPAAGRLLS
ncbi:MAG: two-component system sensor histidine kinase/response regulator [Tardiphaga sp.]|uniref:HWE histidine kinase domain-containing protein n=1 Tax=Tardiphaga sp. TaxID=1926292 RepID=UPI00262F9968|nr:HWE histidine kinase domain-containing protein [Tardiphaga sp.]MDB5503610.1 two-component system sensor histidine kinase/response regulator [Tardiphaga sp.]